MPDIQVPHETAEFLHRVIDLLGRLKAADPDLAIALEHGAARVSFDAGERVICISVVDADGHGHPLIAIQADPFDRAMFGCAGVPTPVHGLYAPQQQTH